MSTLKVVIFDVDGTLAETERDGQRVAFNRAFIKDGLDWHWDPILYAELLVVTGGKERIRHYLENFHLQCGFHGDPTPTIDKLHTDKTRHYAQLLSNDTIKLRSGVKRLIDECHEAGLRLAIATSSMLENIRGLLRNNLGEQAISWFDCIVDGGSVGPKKPAADIYHYCLHQLGLMSQDCLFIEDSANGLQAALGAKLATLITTNNYIDQDDFNGALTVVNHLGEPDLPSQVLAGEPINDRYISVNTLKELHGKAFAN
ncbi:MAG: HAD-IA family hydrolase [Methylophaga sp.]|nr:HAD-IA family hydrolase [Methylophaga sp.]